MEFFVSVLNCDNRNDQHKALCIVYCLIWKSFHFFGIFIWPSQFPQDQVKWVCIFILYILIIVIVAQPQTSITCIKHNNEWQVDDHRHHSFPNKNSYFFNITSKQRSCIFTYTNKFHSFSIQQQLFVHLQVFLFIFRPKITQKSEQFKGL